MLNIAVFDDNYEYALKTKEAIEEALEVLEQSYDVFFYASVYNLERIFCEEKIDIVFLDINYKIEITGIEVAKQINNLSPNTKIIYLTAYNKYSVDISDTNYLYYLLKPIDKIKLEKALMKAINTIKEEQNCNIAVTAKGTVWSTAVNDIVLVESQGHTIKYRLVGGESIDVRDKLDEIELRLERFNTFIRPHKSYVVNIKHIKKITSCEVVLFSGDTVPISRSNQKLAKEQFTSMILEELK